MILKLIPSIGSNIEFDITGLTNGYFYMGDINLNEDKREEIIFSDYDYVTKKNKIVEVTFTVVIHGNSRKNVLEKVKILRNALSVEGKLEYAPNNTSSTFYTYLPSPPPMLIQDEKNSWENKNVNMLNNDAHANMFRVTLYTKAIAKSDIANIGSYIIGNGTYNIDLGSYDTSELHLTMQNINTNDTGEVIIFTANEYEPLLYTQNSTTEGAGWTNSTRTNGLSTLVKVFTPTSTSSVHIYWNAAADDYKGNSAVYLLAKTSSLYYKLKASLVVNNITMGNNIYHSPIYEDVYHLIYVGNIKYPSFEYTYSPKIDIEIKNENDSEPISIDAVLVAKEDYSTTKIVAEAAYEDYIQLSDNRGVLNSDLSFKQLLNELHGDVLPTTGFENKTLYIIPNLEYGSGDLFGSIDGLNVGISYRLNLIYPNEE